VGGAFDRMAEELSEHQRRLIVNERMAAIGQLAAGVAHEINNPIGVIRGYLRTMLPETEPGEHRDELRILDEEAAACQRIADDLLAYARSPELVTADVDVAELLRQTAERFETSGESKGHRIVVRAESGHASIDAQRMRQVLQNLLRNATQASPPQSEIHLEGNTSAAGYVIRVLDRGGGIPAEIDAKIFEPFISGRSGGSGLGLAVCDGIVRAHGGSIAASPRDGGGTEFIITLQKRAPTHG
jgi:signal transduction histidine kinase